MDEPSTTPSPPPLAPLDAPLIQYHAPSPPPGPLRRDRARTLACLFGIDIFLAAGFVVFSYLHEVLTVSKWIHHHDSSLAVILAIVAVLEAVPLCMCVLRWRVARLVGLIFAAAHIATCGMLAVSLWLTLMFTPLSPGAVGWVGLYILVAQGFGNIFLLSLLYGEVVRPGTSR